MANCKLESQEPWTATPPVPTCTWWPLADDVSKSEQECLVSRARVTGEVRLWGQGTVGWGRRGQGGCGGIVSRLSVRGVQRSRGAAFNLSAHNGRQTRVHQVLHIEWTAQ